MEVLIGDGDLVFLLSLKIAVSLLPFMQLVLARFDLRKPDFFQVNILAGMKGSVV